MAHASEPRPDAVRRARSGRARGAAQLAGRLLGYDQPCCRDGARPISVIESWEAMMFKRIDHVEIVTDQIDRTVQFYTDVLGFTVKARDWIERSGLGVPIDLVSLDL